jgi:hypothetical protein
MDRRFENWSGGRRYRGCAAVVACFGVALALGITTLGASSAPSFAAPVGYPTGAAPRSVAIGDLNGDGRPELATANGRYETDTVSVLANRGDGTFRAKRDYPTGLGPVSVAIGDLNGDGRPELVSANIIERSVSVFLNKGDGTFRAKRDYPTGNGPFSVAIGDVNGDGNLDLVTASGNGGGEGTVSVLLNRGDGSFRANVDYVTGLFSIAIAIGDLNGDGKPELAVANADADTVSVLRNRGDGTFEAHLDYATGPNPGSIAIGDLNGDGKPELATANGAGSVSVLANRGDGTFQAHLDYAAGPSPVSLAIGDLNGDGKPELATANAGANSVSVLLNRGDGSFQADRAYATARDPLSVAIGDLNGDGKPDLATANEYANSVSVLANTTSLCVVPSVTGKTVPVAKRTVARANCRLGKIRRAYSKTVQRGRVTAQKPTPYTLLPSGGKVNLVVSRGRKR